MTNKLTDLEICKRIAEIEGVKVNQTDGKLYLDCILHGGDNVINVMAVYNPLTDDALCFQLMVKYDMPPMKSGAPNLYECVFDLDRALSGAGIICDESPNKAICLAIIEAHKND